MVCFSFHKFAVFVNLFLLVGLQFNNLHQFHNEMEFLFFNVRLIMF